MNKLAIIGIVAALMVATTVVATVQEADARIVVRDNDRNNVNVGTSGQQNSGDTDASGDGGLNTANGGNFVGGDQNVGNTN